MKLAVIRRQYSESGGAEQYLKRLLEALAGSGHEVHLFAEHWEGAPGQVHLHRMGVSGSRSSRPTQFAERVDWALRKEPFDCVFSLERTLRQDVYRAGDGVHRVWLERRRKYAPWWKRMFVGLGAFHRNMMKLETDLFSPGNTGRVIVNSEMVRGEILRCFGFPAERIHLVRNGVIVERFRNPLLDRQTCRKRWGFRDADTVMLFCGSGWERKGLEFVLQAMPEDSTCKLLVVGKGRAGAGATMEGRVVFAGVLPDVEQAYAAADLFVFPPIYEPSANVVTEAVAVGLPVITTAQNGASELLQEGVNGSIIDEASNVQALRSAIQMWIKRTKDGVRLSVEDTMAAELHLDRNVKETMKVLIQAAADRRLSRMKNPGVR